LISGTTTIFAVGLFRRINSVKGIRIFSGTVFTDAWGGVMPALSGTGAAMSLGPPSSGTICAQPAKNKISKTGTKKRINPICVLPTGKFYLVHEYLWHQIH